ncbi:MAG: glycosyltransferase [Clostridiales bacterium]|nr:glycosyltransferase [Clostridiales bacterium]
MKNYENATPLVSVVIPVYNGEKYIKLTIESLLNQTLQDFEIICVDDASTDGSYDVISSIEDNRIKVFQNEENQGIAYTRNRAMSLAKGKYIAFMDHDDISPEYRLQCEVDYLNEHDEIDLVGGAMRKIDENGKDMNFLWTPLLNYKYIKAFILLGNVFASGSVMARREFIEKHNLQFKDNQYGAEDYRFWMEASLYGNLANINEVLLHWRTGHGNETGRVLQESVLERKKVIANIHKDALEKNGFSLTEDELQILNLAFAEEGTLENIAEVNSLYNALKTILKQAEEMQLDYLDEIRTMCRKRFGEKVGKAFFLWK